MYEQYQQYKDKKPLTAAVSGLLKPTASDIEGPFYKAGAPNRQKICEGEPTLVLVGTVMDTGGRPIVGAILDFWQADEAGVYDTETFKLRGQQTTDNGKVVVYAIGTYRLETIRPGHYQIGDHEFRCAHIHVKVTAPGHKPLTTQLYFADDEYNSQDHWFDPTRIIKCHHTRNENDPCRFNFILTEEKEQTP